MFMNKKLVALLSTLFLGSLILVLVRTVGSEFPVTLESEREQELVSTPTSGKKLDLSDKNLQKLPEYVLKITDLEELDISNNKLTGALPAEIRQLKKLKVLNCSDNLMTGVPAEIGQLENLEVLNLANNDLTGLPNELGNLKKLKILNLSGNNYSKMDLDIIKKGLSAETKIITD